MLKKAVSQSAEKERQFNQKRWIDQENEVLEFKKIITLGITKQNYS